MTIENEDFARKLSALANDYLEMKDSCREGFKILDNYIDSILARLGLEPSGDMSVDLRAIDAEIDRLKGCEKSLREIGLDKRPAKEVQIGNKIKGPDLVYQTVIDHDGSDKISFTLYNGSSICWGGG